MAVVISAQGTTITFNDGTTPQTVGGVDSFTFGDGEATDIDITDLASLAKEFQQGLQDFGNLGLNFKKRDPNDAGQSAMWTAMGNQATREVIITLPGPVVATFDCYVKSMPASGAVDGVLAGSANCKVTGTIVWS